MTDEYYGIEDHAFSDFNDDSDKHIIESEYVYHPTNEPDEDTEGPVIESEEFFRVSPVYHDPPRRGPAVTEEIFDDTPSTEKIYIPIVTYSDDMVIIMENSTTTSPSTPSVSHEMDDMNPFLPLIEQVSLKANQAEINYDVTEPPMESESPASQTNGEQSPFLPEIHENNGTEKGAELKETPKKSFRLLDDEPMPSSTSATMINSTTEAAVPITNALDEEDQKQALDEASSPPTSTTTTTTESLKDIIFENLDDHDSNLNEIDEPIQDDHLKVIPLTTTKWDKPL